MKHLTRVLLILSLFSATTSFGQTFKFGHFDSNELISLMPERDSALVKLERHSKELQATLNEIQTEYNTKFAQYQQKQATWTAAVLETKQKELEEIRDRFTRFNQNAQQEFDDMRQLLFAPVYKKANDAITAIGKENGFTYIFDLSSGFIPYFNPEQSVDIMPMAKSKLGIPADKKPMALPQDQEPAQVQ
jgi:outer membrane protein